MASLRVPFLVTVSATVGSGLVACGGEVVVQSGTGGSSSSTSTNVTNGQTVSVSTVSVGSGGSAPSCPPEPPSFGSTSCTDEVPVGTVCRYDVSCQSGQVSLRFLCGEFAWEMVAGQACSQPFDSCPGTNYYCDGEWLLPQGSNPPSPCPSSRPSGGEACFSGGMGGVWPACGYYCDDMTSWTVAVCDEPSPGQGAWLLSPCGG